MANIVNGFLGAGEKGGFGLLGELIVTSGTLLLGPKEGPQYTIDGSATNTVSAVSVGRALTSADNGKTLEITTALTITVPEGLGVNFSCAFIPPASGNLSLDPTGATSLNGAGTTLTRAAAGNPFVVYLQARASAVDTYIVSGS